MKLCALVFLLLGPSVLRAVDILSALVGVLGVAAEPQLQLDVLRGLRDATQGPGQVAMPAGWAEVEARLIKSEQAEVRSLTQLLGLKFGSPTALESLRALLRDRSGDAGQRQEALRALVGVRDATLPPVLRELLTDPALRGAALRALAGFDDPATGPALLAVYPALGGGERRDALNTLASRPAYARALLAAMEAGTVPAKDLNAESIRQLRNLKDEAVDVGLTRVYGTFRDVSADKQAEINRYRRLYSAGGSTPGEATRGRAVFARVCQQCHTLFDVGGKVGPDLTGSNRGDLDYLLQNILDPNAVIPNEYRASTVDLKDGRVLTGIVRQPDDRTLIVATATETVTLARSDVAEIAQSELSMMPEGLVAPLADQDYRDLIYYLGRPGQAPMLTTPDTVGLFFNGQDFAMWQGAEDVWRVEQGEIVGRLSAAGAAAGRAEFLRSDMILGDFRLATEVRVAPAAAGGLWFRSEPLADGSVKGYRAALGGSGAWGRLTEDGPNGRGALGSLGGTEVPVEPGTWVRVEIQAVGERLRTLVNGRLVAEFQDAAGARQGIVAFSVQGGRGAEVRFRNLELELNPKSEAPPR